MPRVAPVVPADSDILCEKCGYTLNGLPASGNCPECGQTIAASTVSDRRAPPAWERIELRRSSAFVMTTLHALFRPTQFFRTLSTRGDVGPAQRFAKIHWLITAVFFGSAAFLHATWYWKFNAARRMTLLPGLALWLLLSVGTYFAMLGVTKLAAMLTNWEATYRGLRMPMAPVLRGMSYHAAHYLPVALVTLITIAGFTQLYDRGVFPVTSATTYLYVLCAEVVLGAVYLFQTYWIAMRNMMYANR